MPTDHKLPVSPWAAPQDSSLPLPRSLALGVATSSYQIEGATKRDGRGPSIWDEFVKLSGRISDNSSADVAVDHYSRYAEDVSLMADLNLQAYRFSTSWSRIMPDGKTVNRQGLDFYSRLVDALLEKNITPWLTLYHWDLPQALQDDLGGWASRDIVSRFVDYSAACELVLGDRVKNWLTINEPWCAAFLGYSGGQHAPGIQDDTQSLQAMHHLLLAHGKATQALRSARADLSIGIAPNYSLYHPRNPDNPADVDMARRLRDAQYMCFLEPLFYGRYPEGFLRDTEEIWPKNLVQTGDMEAISTPIDVLGVNYYNSWVVAAPGNDETEADTAPSGAGESPENVSPWLTARDSQWVRTQAPRTEMDWETHPGAFRDLLLELQAITPATTHLVVTENGIACPDNLVKDGVIHDNDRIVYLRDHLAALAEAIDAGADVRAYLLWTLLDNFEWAFGYSKTFGIVHVDPHTLDRTPKLSAKWYSDLIQTRLLGEVPV